MATVATQSIGVAGTAPTYSTASSGGDKVAPGEGTFLHVKNGGASGATVTIATPGTVSGLDIEDRTSDTVDAAGEDFVSLADARNYRNPTDGLADITWSETTSVTFAVLRV